jgi:hypothetical protein
MHPPFGRRRDAAATLSPLTPRQAPLPVPINLMAGDQHGVA